MMNAWLVDVKTISNFQFDIFWTFDDINQISICSFYKMKVLYLNDTQMEKKVWQFNNPQAGFCSKYGGLPRIFLF